MALDETDLDALVAEAAAILDDAAKPFVAGHRADSAVRRRATTSPPRSTWPSNARWSRRSTRRPESRCTARNSAAPTVDSPLVWVLDPIDGTFNYAAGSPMAAILLGLLRDGEPVAGLTWLPFTDERYTAVVGRSVAATTGAATAAGTGDAGRLDRRRRHVQRRLPRPVPGSLPAGGAREPEPEVSRGCGCTAPPASTSPTSPPEYSAAQSVSATTSGITPPVWRWSGPPAASSPTWPAATGPRSRAPRWRPRPACTARCSRSLNAVGDPEDY